MKRSAGVTVIAILSLIGSTLTLLMGIGVAFVFFFTPPTSQREFPGAPGFFKVVMVMAVLMYVAPAVWGVCTSIGLFRLRNWARLSIIVFSILLILTFGLGGLFALVIPLPPTPNVNESIATAVRVVMGLFSATMTGVGIWWIVFFTRQGVVQQFAPAPVSNAMAVSPLASVPPARVSRRPLRITILAWFILVGAMFLPVSLLLHAPAIFFTKVLTGRAATALFVLFATIALYVGIGLLRLNRTARLVGIAYFVFCLANTTVFYLAPGAKERFLAMMAWSRAMFPVTPGYDPTRFWVHTPFLVMSAMVGFVVTGFLIYILITARPAFENSDSATRT